MRRKGPSRSSLRLAALAVAGALLAPLGAAAQWAGEVKPRRAPALPESQWLNTPEKEPLKIEDLKGKVVLVEFWTFACYNCRNVLPYVKGWHRQYADQGLVIVGVHAPEFDFERPLENVEQAVEELGIEYAVALDNDFSTWRRYRNQYWPAMYLVDSEGRIVYQAIGEGSYARTERKIQELLREAGARRASPNEEAR
ncbi:MAG: redoxin domain-containing protein [Candidatus Acidoferrales bacterium]